MLTTNFWDVYISDKKVLIEAVMALSKATAEGFSAKREKKFRKSLGLEKKAMQESFYIKVADCGFRHSFLTVNFAKFSRTFLLKNTFGQLLLNFHVTIIQPKPVQILTHPSTKEIRNDTSYKFQFYYPFVFFMFKAS